MRSSSLAASGQSFQSTRQAPADTDISVWPAEILRVQLAAEDSAIRRSSCPPQVLRTYLISGQLIGVQTHAGGPCPSLYDDRVYSGAPVCCVAWLSPAKPCQALQPTDAVRERS